MDLKAGKTEEQLLIEGCLNCESWAQRQLYELHASAMLGVCVRYVSDRETARDLMQDGFIRLFTKIDSYSGVGSFGGWMRRIFVTTALEYLRQNDVLRQSAPLEEYSDSIEDIDVSVLDKISADDLLGCVARLPEGYRTVFNLYAIEGYTHAEIAGLLKISEVTSRSQFMRARKILQNEVRSLVDNSKVSINNQNHHAR